MPLPLVHSGNLLFPGPTDAVYNVLAHLEPGLMLDVGAAAGIIVEKMLQASPASRVIAFEPFPGNMRFIRERLGKDPRVNIVQKAVSHSTGTAHFHVRATVSGSLRSLGGDAEGYSSNGMVVSASDPRAATSIKVELTTIDAMVGEPVRFMKIDVQGGEMGVLRGAEQTIKHHGVDLIFVEFMGQKNVISFLHKKNGYVLFDAQFILIPSDAAVALPESDWSGSRIANLTSGRRAYVAWPLRAPREIMAYCDYIRHVRQTIGFVWTDLVAVREHILPDFLLACAQTRLASRPA